MSMMSETVKRLFPSEVGELQPKGRHWWQKIDFKHLESKEGIWAMVIAAVILLPGIYYYNKFLNLARFTEMESHQIDVQLQRRRNLEINLARMVVAYAEHERTMYQYVASTRSGNLKKADAIIDALKRGGLADLALPKGSGDAMSKFLAVGEAYPDLKSSANFVDLMNALITSENRIADSRMEYNKAASIFHTAVRQVPGCFYAFFFGYNEKQFHYALVDTDLEKHNPVPYRTTNDPDSTMQKNDPLTPEVLKHSEPGQLKN